MANGRFGATFRQIETLYRTGSLAAQSDGQLLERFLDRREGGEAAFEALVARHGGMVLAVCRRVLGTEEGAEDAFQATFLVLVRQAKAIRNRESLGPWLHGVARRVSLRARRDAARRRERERVGFRVVGGNAPDEALAATLHDEIARLPEKYRTPIVLCDLEGRSHAEAARSLDWPIGTVSGRLSRARALLRSRIARRGIALSVPALAASLAGREARAAISPSLAARTAQVATAGLRGGGVAPNVLVLAGASRTMLAPGVLKVAAGLIASVGVGLGGLGVGGSADRDAPIATVAARGPVRPMLPSPLRKGDAPRPPRQIEEDASIIAFALAPDGLTLASGGLDARVTLWDLGTGLEKQTFLGHTAAVRQVAFTRDGRHLASAADDHTVRVWEVASGRPELTVTCLDPGELSALNHGLESAHADPGPGAPGGDGSADHPAREADLPSGA